MRHNHYEFKREELEVGMEVAKPYHITTVGYRKFRHPTWVVSRVKALTPKKTRVTLEDGRTVEAVKRRGEYSTGLYKPDELMETETAIAKAYREAIMNKNRIHNTRLMGLSDAELLVVATKLREVVELLTNKKHEGEVEE